MLLGSSGCFSINVEIANGIQCEYDISISLDSTEIPQNLKFYYESEQIDINNFKIENVKGFSETIIHTIDWIWDYQTESGDDYDTINSSIGNLNINILITTEYSTDEFKNINNKIDTLPKTGDI